MSPLTGTDAQTERPYRATSCFDTTDAQTERPYTATSCFDTTDAQTVRPYAATWGTIVSPPHRVTRLMRLVSTFYSKKMV